MIICHSRQFVFVKSQKTASSSLEQVFGRCCESGDVLVTNTHVKKHFVKVPERVQVRWGQGREKVNGHMSLDYILEEFPETKDYTFITSVRDPWEVEESRYCYRWDREAFASIVFKYLAAPHYDQNQYFFANGKPRIDHFIRLENIQPDTTRIFEEHGWPEDPQVPHINTSKRKDLDWTLDAINAVAAKYKWIIDRFGYTPPAQS